MECEQCHQVSDWVGDAGEWTLVQRSLPATHPLLECDVCGHRQWAR